MAATYAQRIAYLSERREMAPSEDATLLGFLYFLMQSRRAESPTTDAHTGASVQPFVCKE
jgi:hypothetical protein